MILRYGLSLLYILIGLSDAAAEQVFESGPEQTVMVELYTSEGCNSCPPAEHFLNRLVEHPRLWQTYFPLAFHVDYWDYLGWRDIFASPANTLRQQTYGKVLQARTIYTPEFFVNGKEWRRGFRDRPPPVEKKRVGVLRVVIDDDAINAVYLPEKSLTQPLELHVAVLGMGLASDIRAGENAGLRSKHEFVVLGHTIAKSSNPRLYWQITLPTLINVPVTEKALVAWVSETGNPAPVQATGGFMMIQRTNAQ